MYSRSSNQSAYAHIGAREPSYRQSVRIPPNYGGIAMGPSPPDGVPPVANGLLPLPQTELSPTEETPVSEPYEGDTPPSVSENQDVETQPSLQHKAVLPSRRLFLKHGLGYEELILVGLILLLLWEGDISPDNDLSTTLILLAALLFWG